jgi:hypothetical protein
MTLSQRTWPATFTACVLTSNRPKETEVTTETKVEAVAMVCLVPSKRYPHFAGVEIQLYGGYEPVIGDKLVPQSALDALRGEVVSTNARCIELGERIARLADLRANDAAYIKKLDGIIEETGVRPVSCINPYEDLKAVVLALKKRAAEADAAERRVEELEAVLRPLADANFAEFCGEGTEANEPDDSKVSFPEDRCHITFGMIRRARAALTKVTP